MRTLKIVKDETFVKSLDEYANTKTTGLINHRPLTTDYQPSTHQLLYDRPTKHRPPKTDCFTSDHQPIDHRPSITDQFFSV